jgi:hypothetical protein
MAEDIQDLLDQLDDDAVIEREDKTPKVNADAVIITPKTQEIINTDEARKPIDINKYLDRLDGVTEEVLNACRADRQEAQDVILMLRNEIDEAIKNNKQPSRMYVDGLVKAVEVKSTINMTAVKIIEANAKVLAATKVTSTSVQVNNNTLNVNGADKDLEQILDEPITADDEY